MKKHLRLAFTVLMSLLLLTYSCKQNAEKKTIAEKKVYTVPSVNDIVIYELFVRNFSDEGTINAIIPRLDELKALGVNVIWLMPIQPTGKEDKKGTYGSPYAVQDYYGLNRDFGTKADFKKLVDEVHARGLCIIIDEVANHTAWDNPWVTQHPDWYTHDSTGKIIPPVKDWSDVADLNYDNKEMRKEKIKALKYWVDSFNIDGYRCDAAAMVPNDFWKEAIDTLRKIRPLIMLAESDEPKMYDNGFDMTYGWYMYSVLKNVWKGDSTTEAVQRCLQKEQQRFPSTYRPIRFITNHDEDSWDDVPEKKFINRDGAKAAFVTMITLPGVPLVYNGQEVGYPEKINLFEKYKIDWTANKDLDQWYSNMLHFYSSNDVLKKGLIDQFDAENKYVLIYERSLTGVDPLWVIINASNKETRASLPVPLQNQKITDVISNTAMSTEKEMKLKPYEYHVVKMGAIQ